MRPLTKTARYLDVRRTCVKDVGNRQERTIAQFVVIVVLALTTTVIGCVRFVESIMLSGL